MPGPRRASRHALKRVTPALPRKLARHNPALRMEMPQRLLRSQLRRARPRPSSRRKGIWPRAFPFPPKASDLACPAAPRTERPEQMEEQEAGPRAAVEPRRATEKIRQT